MIEGTNLMFKISTSTSDVDSIEATPALTTQLTGISPKTLRKAVIAGFIPNLSITTVLQLGRLPMVESVSTPGGAPVPFVRMGIQTPDSGYDPGHTPPRKYYGLGVSMSDAEFLASSVRWWKRGGQSRVLAAQHMLVAIGGLTVGLIGGIDNTAADGERIEYVGADLRLIARVDDVLSRDVRFIDPNNVTEEERTLAGQLLPTRSTTKGGGVIGVLDADLSA